MKNPLYYLLLCCICYFPSVLLSQSNVLLIIADDLGVDYLASYGEGTDVPHTPTLDSLAAQSVLFRNAWTNPLCSPTRASVLTGRYPFRHGVGSAIVGRLKGAGISTDEWTIPKALDSHTDYRAACTGKWHLSTSENGDNENPNMMGFKHFSGSLPAQPIPSYNNWRKTINGENKFCDNYATTDNVNDAIQWIDQQTEANPWFHWLAFNAAHIPIHLPPKELHSYDSLSGKLLNVQRQPIPYFKAMVEAMDTEIGRLFAALAKKGTLKNTHVIFIGDNGTWGKVVQAPFDPDRAKGTLYEGGLNVPLFISGPAVNMPGRESKALVNSTDLFATILEMAQVDMKVALPDSIQLDSHSLLPYLKNPLQSNIRPWVFAEMFDFDKDADGKAIRDQQYKLIRFDKGQEELYNLTLDPFETRNLFAKSLDLQARMHYRYLSRELDALLNK